MKNEYLNGKVVDLKDFVEKQLLLERRGGVAIISSSREVREFILDELVKHITTDDAIITLYANDCSRLTNRFPEKWIVPQRPKDRQTLEQELDSFIRRNYKFHVGDLSQSLYWETFYSDIFENIVLTGMQICSYDYDNKANFLEGFINKYLIGKLENITNKELLIETLLCIIKYIVVKEDGLFKIYDISEMVKEYVDVL